MRRYLFSLIKPILFYLGLYFLYRLFFTLIYIPKDISFSNIVLAFLHGIRFDLATTFLLTSIFILPLWLVGGKIFRIMQMFIWIIFTFAISNVVLDFFYYPTVERHVAEEAKILWENFADVAKMGLTGYPFAMFLVLFIIIISFVLFKKAGLFRSLENPIPWKYRFLFFILWPILSIVAIRGGLQSRPLNTAMAFWTENHSLAMLTLNPTYTTLSALYKSNKIPQLTSPVDEKIVRSMLFEKNESFVSPDYIFYREKKGTNFQPTNVVFIILESWNLEDAQSHAPFFMSLTKKSLFFPNVIATSQRSITAFPAIISSIPTLYGRVYTTSVYAGNKQRGFGTLFLEHGYETVFIYGAKYNSMNFAAYSKIAGIQKVFSKKDISTQDKDSDGVWGIYDHVMFPYAIEKLQEIYTKKKKFAAVLYTLHPHPPYILPMDKNTAGSERSRYQKAMQYTDTALKNFFREIQKKPFFPNTLFVLTADHAFGHWRKGLNKFKIPVLFYWPGKIQPQENTNTVSQLGILPTILELIHLPTKHASMAPSFFAKNQFAIMDLVSTIRWLQNGKILEANEKTIIGNQACMEAKFFLHYESAVAKAINLNKISP